MKKTYRNVIKTKTLIRNTFLDLIKEKKSIDNITVIELCEKANIAKSTFYNHYDDIYCVLEELQNELLQKLEMIFSKMKHDSKIDYYYYLEIIFNFLKENEENYKKLTFYNDSKFFIEKLKTITFKKLFEESANIINVNDSKEKTITLRFVINGCIDTIFDYFNGKIKIPLEDIKSILLKLAMQSKILKL